MREKLPIFRNIFIGVLAGCMLSSCSQKMAFTGSPAKDFIAAQQYNSSKSEKPVLAENEPVIAETPLPAQDEVIANEPLATKEFVKKPDFRKGKKMVKQIKRNIATTFNTQISNLQSSATMSVKDDGDALISVGLVFLMLGVLGFVIPPLFFIGLNAATASMLVIVTLSVIVFGLLLIAFGAARNAQVKQ